MLSIYGLFARPMNRYFLLNKIKRAIYYVKSWEEKKRKSKEHSNDLDGEMSNAAYK